MKSIELRELSDAELLKRIQEAEENLAHLRFQKVISQLENPMKIRLTRRDVARMRTVLRERQLKGTTKTPTLKAETQEQKA